MTTIRTRSGSSFDLSGDALEEFRATVKGAVTEGVPPCGRPAYNAMHTGVPALTIQCEGTADVVAAVGLARDNDLDFTVRGGGHSIAGLSSISGGLLIDLEPMRGVFVDPDARIAHVQGGAVWGDVDRATTLYDLATPGGVVSDTGVAGLTLGGGYGWLRRSHGLACDNVVSAQVVTADGRVLTASETQNPDLYWAIRGGGGNFGVVTSLTFRLHPLGPLVGFSATFYPMAEVGDIVTRWRRYVSEVEDEVTSVVVTTTFPADPHMPEVLHDTEVVIVGGVYTGDPEEGMNATKPLRELGTPLFDMSQPMPFTAIQSGFDGLFPRGQVHSYWKAQYADELTDELIATFADLARTRPSGPTMINLFHMGGAIAAVDSDATAFAHRSPDYLVSLDGNWYDPAETAANVAWIREAFDRITPHGTGGVYLNFTGRSDEATSAGVDAATGANQARLAQVKKTYDPTNLFRSNNNIAPG